MSLFEPKYAPLGANEEKGDFFQRVRQELQCGMDEARWVTTKEFLCRDIQNATDLEQLKGLMIKFVRLMI